MQQVNGPLITFGFASRLQNRRCPKALDGQGALHEPTVWCPGFSRTGPPEGGTLNKSRHTVRFRVPMHGKKAEEAFHEPEGRARQSPARRLCIAKLRRARSDAPYRFKAPMHGIGVVGALHEPTFWCPGFSRSGPPEGGTPNKFCCKVRFKVPMHAEKSRMRALHEPTSRPRRRSRPRFDGLSSRTRTSRRTIPVAASFDNSLI